MCITLPIPCTCVHCTPPDNIIHSPCSMHIVHWTPHENFVTHSTCSMFVVQWTFYTPLRILYTLTVPCTVYFSWQYCTLYLFHVRPPDKLGSEEELLSAGLLQVQGQRVESFLQITLKQSINQTVEKVNFLYSLLSRYVKSAS